MPIAHRGYGHPRWKDPAARALHLEHSRRGGLAAQATGCAHRFTPTEAQAAGRKAHHGRKEIPDARPDRA